MLKVTNETIEFTERLEPLVGPSDTPTVLLTPEDYRVARKYGFIGKNSEGGEVFLGRQFEII
jgi:hypothetical protein